jgi:hypothetical protein
MLSLKLIIAGKTYPITKIKTIYSISERWLSLIEQTSLVYKYKVY